MEIFTQQTTPAAVVPAATNNKRGGQVRQPDYLLKTEGYPEIFSELWKTSATSKNAGQLYVSIARIVGEKRNKTWNLHRDFFGIVSALAGLAEVAEKDPAITNAERARYGFFRTGLATLLAQAVMPSEKAAAAKQPVNLAELAATLN